MIHNILSSPLHFVALLKCKTNEEGVNSSVVGLKGRNVLECELMCISSKRSNLCTGRSFSSMAMHFIAILHCPLLGVWKTSTHF